MLRDLYKLLRVQKDGLNEYITASDIDCRNC